MQYDSVVAWLLIGVALTLWLIRKVHKMSASLDRLTREVTESRTAVDSALTLIEGLAQEIRDNLGDDAALEALADDLDAQQADLASAVTSNTAQEQPPTPAAMGTGEEPANEEPTE